MLISDNDRTIFIKMKKIHRKLYATNENNMIYKEINMNSKKVALACVLGMAMTGAWAESSTTTTAPETTVTQADSTSSSSEPQTEVKVEDIDAPVFE